MNQVELRIVVAIVCVIFVLTVIGLTAIIDHLTNKK